MGQITSVRYRRLRNLGNYENEAIEATSDISGSETPEEARLEELERQLQRVAARLENAKVFLTGIGVPIPATWTPNGPADDGLPF